MLSPSFDTAPRVTREFRNRSNIAEGSRGGSLLFGI